MADIHPKNPELLTDTDVEYTYFTCCGDEDLIFLRCAHCGHIWVECYECSTWYIDLNNLQTRARSFLTDTSQRVACPRCQTPFREYNYLMDEYVDAYLPTAQQVIEAGYGKFLAQYLREQEGSNPEDIPVSYRARDTINTIE